MNNLKKLRKAKNMSQLDLSIIVGVSPKTVSAWERGERNPKPKQLQKIEDYFSVKKEDIFFELFDYKM